METDKIFEWVMGQKFPKFPTNPQIQEAQWTLKYEKYEYNYTKAYNI